MRRGLAIAGMTAIAPVLLLWGRTPEPAVRPAPVVKMVTPAVAVSVRRRLFGGGVDDPGIAETVAGTLEDIPVVVGVVGRLPDAAVALVRDGDGRSRSVAVGGVTGGWRLEGLSADSAVFSRGGDRVRVRLADGAGG